MLDLYLGDCLDILPILPEGSADLVLCDPPYQTTQNKWDSVIDPPALWRELKRVVKPTAALVFTAKQPFTSVLITSNLKEFHCEWVWNKNKVSGHLNAKRRPMRSHEDVVVFAAKQPVYNPQMTTGHKPGNYAKRARQSTNYGAAASTEYGGATTRYPRSVIEIPVINNDDPEKWHPTQKPVALMEYLIATYSNPGDTVLDFAMGSGTTGVAALRLGRNFIGIEKEPEYYSKAHTRLARELVSDDLRDLL